MANILNPEFDKVQSTYRASTEDVLYQLQEIKTALSGGGGGGDPATATKQQEQIILATALNSEIANATNQQTEINMLQGILNQCYSLPTIDTRVQQMASCIMGWVNQNNAYSEAITVDCKIYGIKLNFMTLQILNNPGFVGNLNVEVTCSDQDLHYTRVKMEDLKEITVHPYKYPPFNMDTAQVYRMDLKGINKIRFTPQEWAFPTDFLVTLHY